MDSELGKFSVGGSWSSVAEADSQAARGAHRRPVGVDPVGPGDAGAYDVVVAAGVESMTRIPMGVSWQQGPGVPFGPQMLERYGSFVDRTSASFPVSDDEERGKIIEALRAG